MFNDGSSVISTVILHDSLVNIPKEEISEYFEVEKTALAILRGKKQWVGLQFPNELLSYSVEVKDRIERFLEGKQGQDLKRVQLFVLGNSPKSGLDIVAFSHVGCDLVIVYGNQVCLHHPETFRGTDIIHVFGDLSLDVISISNEIIKVLEKCEVDQDPSSEVRNVIVFEPIFEKYLDGMIENVKSRCNVIFPSKSISTSEKMVEEKKRKLIKKMKIEQKESLQTKEYSSISKEDEEVEEVEEEAVKDVPIEESSSTIILAWNGYHIEIPKKERGDNNEKTEIKMNLIFLSEHHKTSKFLNSFLYSLVGNPDLSSEVCSYHRIFQSRRRRRYNNNDNNKDRLVVEKVDNPSTNIIRNQVYKNIRKRYYLLNLVKSAKTFGLIVTTTPSEDVVVLSKYLKSFIGNKLGKKVYVFHVSVLNPPKLANFLEIDIWVNVRCACGQILNITGQESEEYYKPVLTPFEVFFGLSGGNWCGEYILEVRQILEYIKKTERNESSSSHATASESDFSFISGGMIHVGVKRRRNKEGNDDGKKKLENKEEEVEGEDDDDDDDILDKREWKGLSLGTESDLEDGEATGTTERIERGRDGTGSGYDNGRNSMFVTDNICSSSKS